MADEPMIRECIAPYSDGSGCRHTVTVSLADKPKWRVRLEGTGHQSIEFTQVEWDAVKAAVERAIDYYDDLPPLEPAVDA